MRSSHLMEEDRIENYAFRDDMKLGVTHPFALKVLD